MPVPRPSFKLIEQLASEMESRLPGILPGPGRRAGTRVFRHALYKVPRGGLSRPGPTSVTRTRPGRGARWGVLQKTAAPATGSLLIGGERGIADGRICVSACRRRAVYGRRRRDHWQQRRWPLPQTGQAGNTAAGVQFTWPAQWSASTVRPSRRPRSPVARMSSGRNCSGRILERIRRPPHGGDSDDYVAWAKVPGVTRAWCAQRHGRRRSSCVLYGMTMMIRSQTLGRSKPFGRISRRSGRSPPSYSCCRWWPSLSHT